MRVPIPLLSQECGPASLCRYIVDRIGALAYGLGRPNLPTHWDVRRWKQRTGRLKCLLPPCASKRTGDCKSSGFQLFHHGNVLMFVMPIAEQMGTEASHTRRCNAFARRVMIPRVKRMVEDPCACCDESGDVKS